MQTLKSVGLIIWITLVSQVYPGLIILEYDPQDYIQMYAQDKPNSQFISQTFTWSCSSSLLFTYNQTQQQYKANSPYYMLISQFNKTLDISITSRYKLFTPQINQTSCKAEQECVIQIYNNCRQVSYFLYFDVIQITIPQLSQMNGKTLSYNVICDNTQPKHSFTWGQILLILLATAVITLTSTCSKAWSWRNAGFQIKYISIIVIIILLSVVLGFVVSGNHELINIIRYSLVFFTFTLGTFSIMFCTSQMLYLIPSYGLHKGISLRIIRIRIMDLIGLVIGVGLTCGWWFSNKNFLISNIIDICMLIAAVKLIKFTSLKIPVITYICTTVLLIGFIILIQLTQDSTFSLIFQRTFSSPFLLELPTINPVPNQQCSCLYLPSLAFPAIILSYIARFDYSRSSRVYTITFIISFISCSLGWSLISVVSPFIIPFDMISLPIALFFIAFFSNRRNQFPVLWHGLFQDSEYKHNKSHLTQLMQVVKKQKSPSQLSFRNTLLTGLRIKNGSFFSNYSGTKRSSSAIVIKDGI